MEVLALCIDRLGYVKGARLAEFIVEWEMWLRARGEDLGTEDFAAWWKDSRATTYRRLDDFRRAFPELGPHGTPSGLMGPLLRRLEQSGDVPAGIALEVPT